MAVCISVFSAVKKPAHTAEIRRNGSPRGSVAGNGPGFPAHAQAARGLNRSPLTDVAVREFWPPIQTPGGCCMGLRKFTETRPISTGTGQAAASAAGLCVCCVQKHSAMDIIDIVASRHLAAICCRKHRYQMRSHVTTIRYDHCTVGHDTMRYDAIS